MSEKSLKEFKDFLSRDVFAMTSEEAQAIGICVNCKEPALPKCYSDAGREEYRISGLCEPCFDALTGGDSDT